MLFLDFVMPNQEDKKFGVERVQFGFNYDKNKTMELLYNCYCQKLTKR